MTWLIYNSVASISWAKNLSRPRIVCAAIRRNLYKSASNNRRRMSVLRRATVVRLVTHRSTFRQVRGFNIANADETKTKVTSQWKRYGADDPIDRERLWDDMSETVQDHWNKLGWNQVNWGKGHPIPDTEFVSWHDLSTTQKEAATQLGCVHPTHWLV